jgi:S1-C subfamily serine protease
VPLRVAKCRCGHDFAVVRATETVIFEPDERPGRAWLGPTLVVLAVLAGTVTFMMRHGTDEGGNKAVPGPTPAQQAAAQPVPAPATTSYATDPRQRPVVPVPAEGLRVPVVASNGRAEPASGSFEEIVGNASAAVVSIETATGRGSGFFVTPELIVTNAHVVQANTTVTVKLSDGTTLPAHVLRSSPEVDIAIVRPDLPRPGQTVMPMGSVNAARPGQEVIAIGSALGVLQNTVTRGIVSAVRNANGVMLIQTDAAINPGNSGGPLIDRAGRVVGITTLKMASNSESLGFAVAIDHARPLIEGRPAELVARPAGSQTPSPLAGAFSPAASEPDTIRGQGEVQFDRAMQSLARRADSLDEDWDRFRASCHVAAIPNAGDREWFGVWERPPAIDSRDVHCSRFLQDVTSIANSVRTSMTSADETARGASVIPGARRDLRRKYKLDWAGWER